MPKITVDFNQPTLVGKEFSYITQALEGSHISGDGVFTKKCHAFFEDELGVKKALLTTSCTHALEMAALLLEIQPGDEVIVPSFTFVSTINAFVLRGARPVFIDIRPDTLNLDERLLEGLITPRTKAILVVHYAGVGCEMDSILTLANQNNLAVVEDNAHGLFGKYKGQFLGTFGSLATQSFHETKNITCGEGGAILINKASLIERAEIIREKGTNRSRFFRGEIDKYTWVDLGSSYLPSDILGAYLYAQLEHWQEIQARRKNIWETYDSALREWAAANHIQTPYIPEECEQAFHMYYLLLPDLNARTALIEHLKSRGIMGVFHYQPLHLSKIGQMFGGLPGDCPVSESASDRLLRLPFYNSLEPDQQELVTNALVEFHVA